MCKGNAASCGAAIRQAATMLAMLLFVLGGCAPSGHEGVAVSDSRLNKSALGGVKGKEYFVLRGGLSNCRTRFVRERAGRVAFLGGSITHMKGWRDMVCQALRKRFPQTPFDFIDAGIPSTGSTPGAFRLQRDVFGRGRVDLLFVEFAVNDDTNGRTTTEQVRGMEGVIRQARRTNPAVDIVMLYFVDPGKMRRINEGKTPVEIANHSKVARHYGVVSIDLAREVTDRINAGEFTWKQFGGLHPAPFGHRVYARSIERLFDAAWRRPLPRAATVRPHRLPAEPLDARNYSHGRLVDIGRARLLNGWRRVASWKPGDKAQTRPGFVNVPMLVAEAPGAALALKFNGTAVGIFVAAGPDAGIVEFRIDGGKPKRVDLFTQWSAGLHIPWAHVLHADLEPGPHELILRTTDERNPRSTGHAARIVNFLVNRVPGDS